MNSKSYFYFGTVVVVGKQQLQTPGKFLLQQITFKQANILITIFKVDSVTNLLLKESCGAVLAQKSFLFLYDIFIFTADNNAEAMFF
jgi:hypothetical protein